MTRIHIYDTTLRDGSQGEGINFSLDDKLLVTQRLDELGVDFIEGGYPLSNPKDFEYFQRVKELPLQHARVASFGMTRRKNVAPEDDTCLKALIDSNTEVITLVGKTWDLHVREVLNTTPDENLVMIGDSVGFCRDQGRDVLYDAEHFFDGYKSNPEYAVETLRAAQKAGAQTLILCDTNGGTLPDELADIVKRVREAVADVELGIHCHNDCDVAVANTLAAVQAGATQVQGTINGIGERCGNVDLVSVIANLALKRGHGVLSPDSLKRLTEVSRFVYEVANMNFRANQPFVGASAFAHKGGMHAHGIARTPLSYEHIDPKSVGNTRRILISELSGQASISAKTKSAVRENRELMRAVLQRIQELENAGYEFEAAEASFDMLVKKAAGEYQPKFERLSYRVNVETEGDGNAVTEATVKVRIGNDIQHTVSEGDGPVNALDGALRKALQPYFPRLSEMHLADYKVRVVNARAESAARVRVVIEWRDGTNMWGTVGVSENIIEASWLALVDSFEYKLAKDEEGVSIQ